MGYVMLVTCGLLVLLAVILVERTRARTVVCDFHLRGIECEVRERKRGGGTRALAAGTVTLVGRIMRPLRVSLALLRRWLLRRVSSWLEAGEVRHSMFHYPLGSRTRDVVVPLRCPWLGGSLDLPKRVYVNNSRFVTMSLCEDGLLRDQHKDGVIPDFYLRLGEDVEAGTELEATLRGSGIETDERTQRQPLKRKQLVYQWNCHFPHSGRHEVSFDLRFLDAGGAMNTEKPLQIARTIKVVKVDHLTQRQVWVVSVVCALVGGAFGVYETLRRLNVW